MLELEVDDRVGVLDAVLVDERVGGDARRDGDARGRPGAAAAPLPRPRTSSIAQADEADADRLRGPDARPEQRDADDEDEDGGEPARDRIDDRDLGACRYAVARRPKYRSWSSDVTTT